MDWQVLTSFCSLVGENLRIANSLYLTNPDYESLCLRHALAASGAKCSGRGKRDFRRAVDIDGFRRPVKRERAVSAIFQRLV
jgi:hypothetical protein